MRPPLLVVLLTALLMGCSAGEGCGRLDALSAQRDDARDRWQSALQEQQAGQGTTAATREAHERMHDLEQRVYALEQSCGT